MTTFIINKKQYHVELKGHEMLIEVLRDMLGLTGTKTSCESAECGACTVLVDNKAILSCITLAKDIEGKEITTIEGLSDGENLSVLQESFLNNSAVQCGFCTPGMILASHALLGHTPDPTDEDIKHALDGNLCRCTGYIKIFNAVKKAAQTIKENKNGTIPR